MASLRRTKNFATDPQTPMFLYTILKQLDLRSINWNEVADGLSISNGHAARMRYSRMKSQFEGLSNQTKPPKAKKETGGETKSSKSKAKNNKRLLMEDENERIANNHSTLQPALQQEIDSKRIKLESHTYMTPWNSSGMYAGYTAQPYANPYYGQPITNTGSSAFGVQHIPPQSFSSAPIIKKEPGQDEVSSTDMHSVPIKQEQDSLMDSSDMADSDVIIVKREPGTTFAQSASPVVTHTGATPSYPLSHTINTYFDRQQSPLTTTQPTLHGMPMYPTPRTYLAGTYPAANSYNSAQSAFSWPARTRVLNGGMASNDDASHEMMLNPYAASYQDMLNMPLHTRSPSFMQTPNPNSPQLMTQSVSTEGNPVGQEHEVSTRELPVSLSDQDQDGPPRVVTSTSGVTAPNSPVHAAGGPQSTAPKVFGEEEMAAVDVIEVDSGGEIGSSAAPVVVLDDIAETEITIKKEIVEL